MMRAPAPPFCVLPLLFGLLIVTGSATAGSATAGTAARAIAAGDEDDEEPELLPFDELADKYLERLGMDAAATAGMTPEDLLQAAFDHATLGCIEVHYPASFLEDRQSFDDFRDIGRVLIQAQIRWIGWLYPTGTVMPAECKQALDDLAFLDDFVKDWKQSKLKGKRDSGSRDLLAMLSPKEPVAEAAARLAAFSAEGGPFGTDRERPVLARLVLLPTREHFVEFTCAVGKLRPDVRKFLWVEGLIKWAEFHFDDTRALALEFYAGGETGDYTAGMSMKSKRADRFEQQVMQLALLTLFERAYGERTGKVFDAGLASNLVIEAYGEVETRTDGDLKGNTTAGRSAFVPGGNSAGGTFPPNIADSRWRLEHGKFHFVRILSTVQRNGGKEVKRSENHTAFLLQDENEREKFVVRAPFLGADAKEMRPPEAFSRDWEDFQRSYRIAFLHWLRVEGDGNEKVSAQRFGELLRALGATGDRGLVELIPEIYGGTVLSSAALDEDSMEGRFLHWLVK